LEHLPYAASYDERPAEVVADRTLCSSPGMGTSSASDARAEHILLVFPDLAVLYYVRAGAGVESCLYEIREGSTRASWPHFCRPICHRYPRARTRTPFPKRSSRIRVRVWRSRMSGRSVRSVARRLTGTPAKESDDDAFRKLIAERQEQQLLGPPEPPSCPPGWEVGPPTFIGVGTQKSGTQWWSHQLFSHPDAVRPVRKELHYFQHGWETALSQEGVSRYHLYFPRRPGIVTELSPSQWCTSS
jgi:hypothetical protein